jgi:AraC-like DNA-binding protein
MRFEHRVENLFRGSLVSIVDFRCWAVETHHLLPEGAMRTPTLVFPRRGVFYWHTRGECILGDPNQVLFFDGEEPFRISYPQPRGDDCTFFAIDSGLLTEILSQYTPRAAERVPLRFPSSRILSAPDLFLAHDLLLKRVQAHLDADPLPVEEDAVRLVASTVAAGCQTGKRPALRARAVTRRVHRDVAEAVKALLAERLGQRIALGEISRAVGVSPYHLCRIFQRQVGMPIHRYLNRLRLRTSLLWVAEADRSLSEVALNLGYSSHSHFSDSFRREFGLSPSAFRRVATLRHVSELGRGLGRQAAVRC